MTYRKKALDPVQLPGHRIEFVIPRGVRYVVDMELKERSRFQILRLLPIPRVLSCSFLARTEDRRSRERFVVEIRAAALAR